VVVLDGHDCEILARQLIEAIRLGYTARSRPPPERLLDLANQVSAAARSSAQFRASAQVSGAPGTGKFCGAPVSPGSDQEPATLTVQEAAKRAEVSEGFMRRSCRRGDVAASRHHQGAWAIDTGSLDAWSSRRRKDQDRTRKAA
jgi:hypothetical protein